IDNACTAVEGTPAPRVHVDLTDDDDPWVLRVLDSGNGPDPTKRIFDLGVSTQSDEAHGVGLALVQHCVHNAGGRITVTGSCFEVVFPQTVGMP
ncbi:MAG: ATP-binding protein, partial [Mycetocola sp.]